MGLPPYSFTAILRVESKKLNQGEQFINEIAKYAKSLKNNVVIFDPLRPTIERVNSYERFQLFFQAKNRNELQNLLKQLRLVMTKHSLFNKIKWALDIDPIEF